MHPVIQAYILNQQLISMERLEGEVVIISFDTGKYFSSADSGADILWLIKDKVHPSKWDEILKERFNVDEFPGCQIVEFLEHCLGEGIIKTTTEELTGIPKLPEDYDHASWSRPLLLAFADLQDLLTVDPIHDSSLEGWPQLKDNEE